MWIQQNKFEQQFLAKFFYYGFSSPLTRYAKAYDAAKRRCCNCVRSWLPELAPQYFAAQGQPAAAGVGV